MSDGTFRVMTYNVHSCRGRNGIVSQANIAKVISAFNPDIIALQELDAGMERSGLADQAEDIARALNMAFHFHPSLHREKGKYGNAVLSRFPMKLIRADALPTGEGKKEIEKRGALWVQIEYAGKRVQVINTHLGLNRKERLLQMEALLGPTWLKHPECRPPIIFCADLNALPGSEPYKKLRRSLVDTHERSGTKYAHKTWPSRFPLMRIDYIFVSPDLCIKNIIVPRSKLAQCASDHLPVVSDAKIIPEVTGYAKNP